MNLWMIVCSYSCPKNVLDKSAEDILPGDFYYGGDTITGDIVFDNDEALEATCKLSMLFIC